MERSVPEGRIGDARYRTWFQRRYRVDAPSHRSWFVSADATAKTELSTARSEIVQILNIANTASPVPTHAFSWDLKAERPDGRGDDHLQDIGRGYRDAKRSPVPANWKESSTNGQTVVQGVEDGGRKGRRHGVCRSRRRLCSNGRWCVQSGISGRYGQKGFFMRGSCCSFC